MHKPINIDFLHAGINLLNLRHIHNNVWWVRCNKDKNNKTYKAYNSTLVLHLDCAVYKQTRYPANLYSTLLIRIAKDMKGYER